MDRIRARRLCRLNQAVNPEIGFGRRSRTDKISRIGGGNMQCGCIRFRINRNRADAE